MYKLKSGFLRLVPAFLLIILVIFSLCPSTLYGQLNEPDVRPADDPRTPLGAGFENRIGGSFILNNFGFGLSGIYGRAVGPFTEITFSAGITGIRDASGQQFFSRFTGRRVVPNKFKRGIGFPITIGIKQRIFPYAIADNFRFFVSASGGPAFAFTYPYFEDLNDNGYRDRAILVNDRGQILRSQFTEDINDFFSGWGEGEGHWGFAGDISIGVDLGSNFGSQVTFEIGYFFFYYPKGLQIMEPTRKDLNIGDVIPGFVTLSGQPPVTGEPDIFITAGSDSFFDAQEFFGTPQIKFTYSGWW